MSCSMIEQLEHRTLLASTVVNPNIGVVYAPTEDCGCGGPTTPAPVTTTTKTVAAAKPVQTVNRPVATVALPTTRGAVTKTPDTTVITVDSLNGTARPPEAFQLDDNDRWSTTATNGGGLTQGRATTIRYSIVPDGTTLTFGAQGNGEANTPSNLRAFFNSIYGNMGVWLPIITSAITSWAAQSGLSYVYEPNDDGVAYSDSNNGIIGTRGDVRIGGHAIDGNSNVLAYNFFPNYGDMVIDTADNFYASTFNSSQGLRNVIAHEHGHGIGLQHVCPINETKLMEPFISFDFTGPQFDDILAANRAYGDRFEKVGAGNDVFGSASPLGALPSGVTSVNNASVDDEADVDYYGFSLASNRSVTFTLAPVGTTYLSGAQNFNGSCSAGTSFNAAARSDLSLQIVAANGTTILGSSNAVGLGLTETISNLNLAAGSYFIRVAGSTNNRVQMYNVSANSATGSITAGIAPVSPDPRTTPVSSIAITFSQAVNGFDLSDLTLTRDGFTESLAGATLTSGDNITFTLGNLAGITDRVGAFTLTLTASGSGITTQAGGTPLAANAVETWLMTGLNGTGGDDSLRILRNGTLVNVFINNATATPTYSYLFNNITLLTVTGGAGADNFIVDHTSGSPLPAGGASYDGGTQSDRLSIIGTDVNDVSTISSNSVIRSAPSGTSVVFTATETLDLTNGTYNASGDLFLGLAVNGNTTVNLNATQHLSGLTIGSGGLVNMNTSGSRLLVTTSLAISGTGLLDMFDNDLIVDNSTSSQLATVQALINSGRAGGAWTGPGITSTTARNAVPKVTTLGAMTGADYASVNAGSNVFAGQSVSGVATLVKYTYYGDANFSGTVNFDDYSRIDGGFNNNRTGWVNGDFNGNGPVNFDDYSLIDSAFNFHGPQL